MTVTQNNGFEFVSFIKVQEDEIKNFCSIAGSFAIIKCDGKILIVYNKWRKQWELPAGKREGMETEKECAIRELFEETGQIVKDMEFKGLLKLKHSHDDQVKYNPVFYSELDQLQPFIENEETTEIKLWDQKESISCIDEIDLQILRYI